MNVNTPLMKNGNWRSTWVRYMERRKHFFCTELELCRDVKTPPSVVRKPEPALCAQLTWQIAGQYRLFKNCSTSWGWSVVFTMSGTGASLWNKLRGGAYLVDRAFCGRSWCNSLLWFCTWWWRLHGEGYKWYYGAVRAVDLSVVEKKGCLSAT